VSQRTSIVSTYDTLYMSVYRFVSTHFHCVDIWYTVYVSIPVYLNARPLRRHMIHCICQFTSVSQRTPIASTYDTLYMSIFTFNKHFDKEKDCVDEPVITKTHYWCRLFITFYIVNFKLFKNKNSLARFMDLPVLPLRSWSHQCTQN